MLAPVTHGTQLAAALWRATHSDATTAAMERECDVSPDFLLRVGGLPINAAERLKDPWMPLALAKSAELAAKLTRYADSLSVSLYEAINMAKGNATVQHALLSVRRGVHNGRKLVEQDVLVGMAHLDEDTCEALAEWRRLKQELDAHNAAADIRVQASFEEARQVLKQLAQVREFRQGILLSSPSFERALNDYVHAGAKKLDKKQRRTERTLLSYVLRTTHKTSPFSTLTAVSMGRFDDRAPARGSRFEMAKPGLRIAVRPNLGVLARLGQALRQNVTRFAELRLSLQPYTPAGEDGRIGYWKRLETPVKSAGPVHTKVSENRFWIHRTATLEALLRHMDGVEALPVSGIVALLGREAGLAEGEAHEYIRILVENGLLDVHGLRRSIFEAGYWEEAAEELEQCGGEALRGMAGEIREIVRLAGEFEKAPGPMRAVLMQQATDAAARMLAAAGSVEGPPSPMFYEDSRVDWRVLPVHRDIYRAPLEALGELQRMFALFDPFAVTKASLAALFKKRFGAGGVCHDLLGFSSFFQESFYKPYLEATHGGKKATDQLNPFGRGNVNPLRLPEVTRLQKARTELLDEMDAALRAAAGSDEFRVPVEWVERTGREMDAALLSNSFFVQAARLDDETVFVLNHVYAGYGCMFTRFTHLFAREGSESLEQALRENLRRMQPEGALFAEMQGGHETNLNQHRLLAEAEIVFPGERASADAAATLLLSDLEMRHDAASGEVYLYCPKFGKRIVPAYLGMLYPLVLPELQTLFLHFAPPTVLKSALSPKMLPEAMEVLHQPRIRYKQVIVERARWTVRTRALPARQSQEKDYEYLLRFTEWRKLWGVPADVFALLVAPDGGAAADEEDGNRNNGALAGQQKPFYLDLEQPLFLLQLEKLAADNGGYIQFTECLPSPKDAVLFHGEDRYVSEFVIDVNQAAAGAGPDPDAAPAAVRN